MPTPARRVCVVTSSRADLAHLLWPLRLLREEPGIDLTVLACAASIAPEYGNAAGRLQAERIRVLPVGEPLGIDTAAEFACAIGCMTSAFARRLSEQPCDLLILVADRAEMLAAATAALVLRIPILHIEGGERSEGAIDNAVRDALTAMSHVHAVTTESARARVISMGEEPWRVHRIGAASLDHLTHGAGEPDPGPVLAGLGLDPSAPLLLAAVHPVTLAPDPCEDARRLIEALDALAADGSLAGTQVLFAFPNADDGGREVRRICTAWAAAHRAAVAVQLEAEEWFALLRSRHTRGIVGNSSSVVMEAPAVRLPGVLIGERQRGRELGPGTVWVRAVGDAPFASPTAEAIADALRPLLLGRPHGTPEVWARSHPYGDGHACERLVETIRGLPGRDALLDKRLR